ncbi:MAG: CPBP family intramembrane metalloprotease [Acidobacteria bacterium]|nr:CPBP family intramembrane metalloprotease [Acidobacteriota bacterium]
MELSTNDIPISADPEAHATDTRWSLWFTLIGLSFSLQIVWSVILLVTWRWKGDQFDFISGSATAWQWAVLVTNCGLVLLILRWQHQRRIADADLGLDFSRPVSEAVVGLLAGAVIWAAASAPLWLLGARSPEPVAAALGNLRHPESFLLILTAAFCEEIIWRGLALRQAHQRFRLSVSVFMVTVGFTIFHVGDALQQGPLVLPWWAFIGFAMSALYLWRRKLVAAMVAHFLILMLG